MIVAVQGSKSFSDYTIFLRAMRTALYAMGDEDREITILSAGPVKVNNMSLEFSNVSENGLRARGIKIQSRRVPESFLKGKMQDVDYFAFFSKPGEPVSKMVDLADRLGVDAGVYTYS
jgi:hypothetical protein